MLKVAVVGGGWAGCAAAVELARRGAGVTLFEAARTLGGRARRIEAAGRTLDNGQHIMLGAYAASLKLMRTVGIDFGRAMLSVPLQMCYPPGGMRFVAPRLPAPLHLAVALLRASGLAREDKLAMARFSTTARWMGWRLDNDCTVAELLERFDQTPRLINLMWRPLCLAALNTPIDTASAQVFLAVLRDSLGARRKASDMLLPRHDLSALFPDAAAQWLQQRGAAVRLGAKITELAPHDGIWRLDGEVFDKVVLAASPVASAALLAPLAEAAPIVAQLAAFTYEPITTCYLQYEPGVVLPGPFFALEDAPAAGHWGQFVFDRGQLDPAQAGLLAVVVSASGAAAALPQQALAQALAAQLAQAFGRPALAGPGWTRVVTEKRATYACTAGLARPANATPLAGLALAGDFTAGEYPATLEMAVRSGQAAARLLC
ncbi:hydroxysqualene dehydroxylase HpnE [Pseudoduganella umbonata]|uniref:FAD-dependent oxidoreductase n=1 Tax=Pseudoduganella umbonata TaxID=864828 RepID=A0A4P8HNT1_9BURK|nr:hydroxysqualene dehydroxylase HpnE [Pseudoduganella umbonata]MBB3220120.1 squalene-associated FAD-dependent desaturase [Pseudoduganella umbonata]QCP10114.1 FAD-dependent oxidoreductase [Pseudoduganella umbonata]